MAEQREHYRRSERQRAAASRRATPRPAKALAAAVPVSEAILVRAALAPQTRSAERAAPPQVGVIVKHSDQGRDKARPASPAPRSGLVGHQRRLAAADLIPDPHVMIRLAQE